MSKQFKFVKIKSAGLTDFVRVQVYMDVKYESLLRTRQQQLP